MKLCKFKVGGEAQVGILGDSKVTPISDKRLMDLLEAEDVAAAVAAANQGKPISTNHVTLLAPLDEQEVWAAGVTYKRSQTARMEESEAAASCYDRVYEADRPELFFKATPHRVVGPGNRSAFARMQPGTYPSQK